MKDTRVYRYLGKHIALPFLQKAEPEATIKVLALYIWEAEAHSGGEEREKQGKGRGKAMQRYG